MALSNPAFENLQEEVMATLGGNLVDVELTDSDIELAFKKAKRIFKQKASDGYRRLFYLIDAEEGKTQYDLPEDPKIDTIIKIIRPNSAVSSFDSQDLFNIVAINDLFYAKTRIGSGSSVRFLEYEMTLSEVEKFKRYSAYDIDFRHDKFGNKLTVFRKPLKDEKWFVDCSVSISDDEYSEIDWIVRWTISEAKIMLGTAYRKFQSVAAPTGETNLAGSEYIQEAKEEQRMLMEEVENLTSGSDDWYGVYIG